MGITRREFLKSVAAAGAGVLAPGLLRYGRGNPLGNAKPNIILIFPDEWRWDAIGVLKLAPVQTPNVDLIANNGVIFSNCYTCGPLCMPARASMMTGQYVHEHGQWNNNITARDPTSPCIHSHVKRMRDDAGYHTALIGKTHLHEGLVKDGNLDEWGFDYSDEIPDAFGLANDPTTSWASWLGSEKYDQFLAYMNYYKSWFEFENPWGTPPLDMPPPPPHDPDYQEPYDLTWEDHYDIYVGRKAAEWIRNYQGSHSDQPFYLQVNFPGPHFPENSTTNFRNMFKISHMRYSLLHKPVDVPLVKHSRSLCDIQDMKRPQNQKIRQIYFANQRMVDVGIGNILQALQDCGFDENTWIFFSSDHGEMLGDHYLMYKSVFYDSSTKVPLIIRPPSQAVATGWVSTGLTDHLDLTTSLLDVAGLPPMLANHGTSLLAKVAAGPRGAYAQTGKDQVVSEIKVPDQEIPCSQLMLRTKRYKMNVQLSSPIEPVELYDLVKDPNELKNVINRPSYSGVRTEMLDRIYAFYPETLLGCPMPQWECKGIAL